MSVLTGTPGLTRDRSHGNPASHTRKHTAGINGCAEKYQKRQSMDPIIITGYIAGTLTTISFVPQVLRAWRLRETRDLSLAMLLLFAAGILLWTLYGIWTSSLPIISANVITFFLLLILLGLKIRYH